MSVQLRNCLGNLQDGDYWQLPFGKLIVHGNELHLLTENSDPAAFSLLGFTEGKWSWKDDQGLEKVLLGFRVNAKGDGGYYFGCYSQTRYDQAIARGGAWADKALDYAMLECATLNPDGMEFRVPVKASAGIAGVAAASGNVRTSGSGRFVEILQDDGNNVTYDTHLGAVGDPNAAIYATFQGHIRDMAAE